VGQTAGAKKKGEALVNWACENIPSQEIERCFLRNVCEVLTPSLCDPEHFTSGKLYDTGNFVAVNQLTEVSPGIFLVRTVSQKKGTLELPELTLAIKRPNGLLLVDGCSHAGIEAILEAASAVDPRTEIVFGGLHLVTTPVEEIDVLVENLKTKWKVQRIAPGHCTGEPAFARLKKAYGENYLYAGLGTKVEQ
jgi:7,8-dihydropterin-6-yl-methyl-4-(beta-D-ribofuranosyl)aminobenzene 5'-phosphate synthase